MKYYFILSIVAFCSGCIQPPVNAGKEYASLSIPVLRIEQSNELLHFDNGNYLYGSELFNGIIIDRYENGNIKSSTAISNGKEEGWKILYYPAGTVSEKRYYHYGEKDSVHAGWWENGNPRFEYHFAAGHYEGDFKEWFESGSLYKHLHYTNGQEERGMGWRENGKQYMNYVMKNGRRYGIVNPGLCYTLKNENGEYLNAGK